ncbi:MAG: aspartate aminotransferase family protein [Abditibacteriales bacterium]|nr:aspartate aminotransferase family protein [Abditibacteriales bacterium]MDW8365741.1 aspartate aminotransferase family protein [Abditibacteriales bacterium]
MRQFAKSLALFEEARRLIPGGSQTINKRPNPAVLGQTPIYVERAKGCRVWDVDGNEFIDYVQALGPITLGYGDPTVDAAVREQLDKGMLSGLLYPLEVEVAREVVDAVPCAEMVRFFKSGAEATSAAARIARALTGREKIVHWGYHGWHDNWTVERNDGGVPKALASCLLSFRYNDLDSLRAAFDAHPNDIAAVIMVATQTTPPATGFLQGVRQLCDARGALLIFDEIVTGFRLARGGAQEFFGVTPDLACFAKGIANGMPLAAVVGKREVMQIMERLIISTTYGGEALSLAAARVCLQLYRNPEVFKHLWTMGERLMAGINAAAQAHGVPARCVGFAPMSLIEFHGDTPAETDHLWNTFLRETAQRGVLFRRGGLAFITLAHAAEDIEQTVAVCDEVFANM